MIRRYLTFAFFILTPFLGQAVEKPHVQAELLSEVMSVQPSQPFWVAVRLKMDPQWHTYWKNPGDSGIPSKIIWTLPPGFTASDIHWPAPKRIELPPLASFGYEGEAYLLTEITPPAVFKSAKNILIQARVDWLECKEACLPGRADLKIELPVSIEPPVPNVQAAGNFSLARFLLPIPDFQWKVEASQDDRAISIVLTSPPWFKNENPKVVFFPDEAEIIDNAAPQKVFQTDGKLVVLVQNAELSTGTGTHLSGVLVADFGWSGPQTEAALSFKVDLPQAPSPYVPPAPHQKKIPFWIALLLAFAGGALLNLMPCVLPVLSIKVLGFIKQGEEKYDRFFQAMLYLAGVVVSFWILAAGLLLLRRSGESVGWGFQLQSVPFVALLTVLFFLMALNLFGVFEIGLSLTRLGGVGNRKSKIFSSFMSGVLATVVATPCTAPFMSSALGYALTVGPAQSMLIFTSLALGMGIPYVLLSMFPKLLSFLPKPGPWMDTFKQSMGFLFLATVVWLLWVIERQGGPALSTLLGILFVIGMSLWSYGKFQLSAGWKAKTWLVLSLLLLLGGLGASYLILAPPDVKSNSKGGIAWEPYSLERVEAERKAGRPVFVDFTAAWCLTCQVNERVAFSSEAVIQMFKEKNIAAFKADWTSRDEKITTALNNLGRNGVPVYAYYKDGSQPNPVLLPEILTPGIVLDSIK